jgi:hypothetical protein
MCAAVFTRKRTCVGPASANANAYVNQSLRCAAAEKLAGPRDCAAELGSVHASCERNPRVRVQFIM